jgi:predicted nucleic acid-binding protein
MNGNKRFFLDTNTIIELLAGNQDVKNHLDSAEWVGTSIICHIEFLTFKQLSKQEINHFNHLVNYIDCESIDKKDRSLINQIIEIRKKFNLKLPDAIIVAQAVKTKSKLITYDKEFKKIKDANLVLLEK